MQAKISPGNRKLGHIPNVSLIPVKDCVHCEACKTSCYALKAWRMYRHVRNAWTHNSKAVRSQYRSAWFQSIHQYLEVKRPHYFRWHVAGDIPDQHYYECLKKMARLHLETNFICFTKQFTLNYAGRPKNLAIVLSMYPGMSIPKKKLPRAWMQDGTETRIPENAIECSGHCDTCHVCWNLKKQDVYFHKH